MLCEYYPKLEPKPVTIDYQVLTNNIGPDFILILLISPIMGIE